MATSLPKGPSIHSSGCPQNVASRTLRTSLPRRECNHYGGFAAQCTLEFSRRASKSNLDRGIDENIEAGGFELGSACVRRTVCLLSEKHV